jgi:hypothetical protein
MHHRSPTPSYKPGGEIMLWTIAIIFFLLWALGLVSSVTLGGYIHVLLGVTVALLLVQFIKGRNRKSLGHSET